MNNIKEPEIRDYYLELVTIQNNETREQFRNGYLGLPMSQNVSVAGNKAYRIGCSVRKTKSISNCGGSISKIE